jgi:hypothetical protein
VEENYYGLKHYYCNTWLEGLTERKTTKTFSHIAHTELETSETQIRCITVSANSFGEMKAMVV